MSDLIRWNDTASGSHGQFGPFSFIASPLYTGDGYLLVSYIPGMEDRRARGTLAEVKATAGTWLREFVTSLGALLATDLRAHLERSAATEQELGDDYAETPGETALEQAHGHWGRAEAYREIVRHVERELEAGR